MKTIEQQNIDHAWGFLVAEDIATDKELQLVTHINGYNWEALMAVLEVRTSYKDIEQYIECEGTGCECECACEGGAE